MTTFKVIWPIWTLLMAAFVVFVSASPLALATLAVSVVMTVWTLAL